MGISNKFFEKNNKKTARKSGRFNSNNDYRLLFQDSISTGFTINGHFH
jgi:hypothetical protein